MKDQSGKTRGSSSQLAVVALVTVACMLLFMLNNGVRANFGLISSAVSKRSGLPEETISLAVAIAQLLYGLSQPFFGVLALKKSNSFVLGLGGILMGAGLLLIPLSRSAGMLILSLGLLVGLAAGALAFGVVMGAAAPAIGQRYAAAASGIINGAGGLGGAVLAPYLQGMNDHGLFSQSMIGLACAAGCAVLLCVWLGKKERAMAADGAAEEAAPTIRDMLKEAFTSSQFMHLALAFFTCGFFMAIIETYLYPQLISYGLPGGEVALLFTVYGVMGMVGPVIAGFLCSKINPKWVLGSTYGLRPVLVLLFLLLPKTSAVVYAFVIGLGLVGNATVPATTLLISKFFGNRKMPTLSGIAMVFHQIGSAVSTWLGDVLIRSSGGYGMIWLCGAAAAAGAALLCYTIRERRG